MTSVFGSMASVAYKLVRLSTKLGSNPNPERMGGYLFWAPYNLSAMCSTRIGEVSDPSKGDKYLGFSREKIFRTYADFIRDSDITVSSWQTRNERAHQYGGAVLFNRSGTVDEPVDVISFSGLAEQVDEAVSLMIGHELGLTDESFIGRVLVLSGNEVFPELREAFRNS